MSKPDILSLRDSDEYLNVRNSEYHSYSNQVICDTDARGFPTHRNLDPSELVLDESEGFIPLWAEGSVLRWRFQERSLSVFQNPSAIKSYIKNLMSQAMLAWGDAAPITLQNNNDLYDFEVVI